MRRASNQIKPCNKDNTKKGNWAALAAHSANEDWHSLHFIIWIWVWKKRWLWQIHGMTNVHMPRNKSSINAIFVYTSFVWAHFNHNFLWIVNLIHSPCVCLFWSVLSLMTTQFAVVFTHLATIIYAAILGGIEKNTISDQVFQLLVYQMNRDTIMQTAWLYLWWFNLLFNTSFSLNWHPMVNEKFKRNERN